MFCRTRENADVYEALVNRNKKKARKRSGFNMATSNEKPSVIYDRRHRWRVRHLAFEI